MTSIAEEWLKIVQVLQTKSATPREVDFSWRSFNLGALLIFETLGKLALEVEEGRTPEKKMLEQQRIFSEELQAFLRKSVEAQMNSEETKH